VIDEMGLRERTIGVASVGCSVFAYNYFDFDFVQAPHGRAPAMATGVKRSLPDRVVLTYQGDGDLASIGMGEIVAAAGRGENITVIFINNANYGMTGGQMAPTTLPGQRTSTSPSGRDVEQPVSRFGRQNCWRPWMVPLMLCGAACTIPRIFGWRKKRCAWLLRHRCADWAFRWLNCFPYARRTGD
jgi:pyruvate/2-oxoacid:ferredoxin oxidoreductase beta subunit